MKLDAAPERGADSANAPRKPHTPERAAYSVNGFCTAHDISRALFYKAMKDGWGPRTMKCAGRRLISVEAAADWRRKMEEAA